MKRDPLRQLERLRQMRQDRATAELSSRSDELRRAEIAAAQAEAKVGEQAASARREEHAMLAELSGRQITRGALFRLQGKIEAFAAEQGRLAETAAELSGAAEECAERKEAARKVWLARQKAMQKIDLLVKNTAKRLGRRAIMLGEAADEDAQTLASAQLRVRKIGGDDGR